MSLKLQQRIIYYINHSKYNMLSIDDIKLKLKKEERFELIPMLIGTIDELLEKHIIEIKETNVVEYYGLL